MTKHKALPVKEENGEPVQRIPLQCSHLKSKYIIKQASFYEHWPLFETILHCGCI